MCDKTTMYVVKKAAKLDRVAASLLVLGGHVESLGGAATATDALREAREAVADESVVRLVLREESLQWQAFASGSQRTRMSDATD